MKTQTRFLISVFSASLLMPASLHAQSTFSFVDGETVAARAKQDALYTEGTRAINDGRWAEAAAIFAKAAQQHGQRAEAALYWQAYAESKEGKSVRALELCKELRHNYPNGRWINECGALEIEIRGKNGDPMPPQAEKDEDLKLLALNALMQQDEGRALPALQQILNSDRSEKLKDRALFVLAQNQSQPARDLLGQIARGQKDPELQRKAIQMSAAIEGQQAVAMLADVYSHSVDEQVKKAILQAYLITGSPGPLVDAAIHESDQQLAKAAVQSLGALGATPQLLDLYRGTKSTETKEAVINGLIAAGPKGSDALGSIATTEQDPELRRRAIRNLGITGGIAAAPSLMETYRKSSDAPTRKAVIEALFLAGDSHDLVELARGEKDPVLKQAIVQQLSLMQSKEATDYMLEILNK